MTINEIGKIQNEEGQFFVQLDEKFIPGLKGLEGFSHLTLLWWFDKCDTRESRSKLEIKKPYVKAPDVLGVFATRSPERPNPIAVSIVEIIRIDDKAGRIYVTYSDAFPGSMVIDIKPYTPSIERVEHFTVPEWCSHWPTSYEASGEFDWEKEFIY